LCYEVARDERRMDGEIEMNVASGV
jgi:hypothetical protein